MLDKIFNVNCIDFLETYNGPRIDLVVTDPPYNLPSWEGGGFMDAKKTQWISEMNVDNLSKSYDICKYAELINKAQGNNINAYFFCNKLQIPEYFKVYVDKYKCKFDILCWHKQNAMPTFHGKYLTDTEYILYFRNNGGCNPQRYEDARTFFIQGINLVDKKKYKHPTIKPLNIVATLIRNSSNEGDVVFDGFIGSGTTAIAAIQEKRHFIGCELDATFYKIAQDRIKNERQILTIDF